MNRIPLARLPTPIERLDRLSEEWGAEVCVKRDDLTGTDLSGNKVRKLEFLLADARGEGATTIITCGAVTSNHARAAAIAARKLYLDCHLVLAGDPPVHPTGNLQLDLLTGAKVHYITREDYTLRIDSMLEQLAEDLRRKGERPYVIPTGGSNAVGLWGYVEAVRETQEQCAAMDWQPEFLACAVGSGGTYAGIALGCLIYDFKAACLGILVCGSVEGFSQKIHGDIAQAIQRRGLDLDYSPDRTRLADEYIGGGYAQTNTSQMQFIRHVAQEEALILDPVYTGKAFYGVYGEIQKGNIPRGASVLFFHTGGIFGLPSFDSILAEEWKNNTYWEDRFR